MGSANSYRYVNTNSVPNTNSGTYSFPINDTGGTKDLGSTNTYRYVNAGNVYNKGKQDTGFSIRDVWGDGHAQATTPSGYYLVVALNYTCSFSNPGAVTTVYSGYNGSVNAYAVRGANVKCTPSKVSGGSAYWMWVIDYGS